MFFFFVAVLCVLCVFVVKNPLSIAALHRTCMVAAQKSTAPCLNGARLSTNVRHQYGAFSARPASSISVGCLLNDDMINRNVIKCNHLYRQLPSSALSHPIKTLPIWRMWGFRATTRHSSPSSFQLAL
jgi:hypothetical protein